MSYIKVIFLERNTTLTSYHQLEEFGEGKRREEMPARISQNPPCWKPSWLSHVCATWKGPRSEWLARNKPEINPIIIKSGTVSHVAEQSSWVPSPSCSLPRHPFLTESLALSACVSPWTIELWMLDKRPGKGPAYCNKHCPFCYPQTPSNTGHH